MKPCENFLVDTPYYLEIKLDFYRTAEFKFTGDDGMAHWGEVLRRHFLALWNKKINDLIGTLQLCRYWRVVEERVIIKTRASEWLPAYISSVL